MRPTPRLFRSRTRTLALTLGLGLATLVIVSGLAAAARGDEDDGVTEKATVPPVDFATEVQPILAEHCLECHGPDPAYRKARLRLDTQEGAYEVRPDGAIVAPGDPDASLLIERISTDDEFDRMPPTDHSDGLTEAEVATLTRWIEEGAKWAGHWAYQPQVRAELPELSPEDAQWAKHPIDHFVAAKRRAAGLDPSPRASREMWLRRVTFDLTGLPPTNDEVSAFLGDEAPDAYERVVDRLLASERYGERQAQEWLDVARYADTNGYQADSGRSAWKWREWVIQSFNENKSFDQFTIEQLAGDLLPDPTTAQKVATGFNRNHPVNSEAGEEPDEYRSVYVIDRVGTTATTWLGLTLACAQCHDHKFDELSQKDFYKFYGFFNHIDERDGGFFGRGSATMAVPTETQEPRLADLERRIDELKQRLDREDPIADEAQAQWEERTLARIGAEPTWTTAAPIGAMGHKGSILERLDDGSIQAIGTPPVRDTYDVVLKPGKRKIAAIRLEVLPPIEHPVSKTDGDAEAKPKKAPMTGRSDDGRFVLSQIKVRVSSLSDGSDPPLVYWAGWDTDLNQTRPEDPGPEDKQPQSFDGSIVIDEGSNGGGGGFRRGGGGWSIVGDERTKPHEAILLPLETLELNDVSVVHISMVQTSRPYKSLISRFRISYTEDESVRDLLLPTTNKLWSSVGPFPSKDVHHAFATQFEPEKDLATGMDLKKKFDPPVVEDPNARGSRGSKGSSKGSSSKSDSEKEATAGKGGAKPESEGTKKKEAQPSAKASPPESGDAARGKGPGKGKGSFKGKGSSKQGSPKGGSPKSEGESSDNSKGDQTSKPKGSKPGDSKPKAANASTAKADAKKPEAKKPAKPEEKPAEVAEAAPEQESNRRRRRPRKLEWQEQRWMDGRSFRLSGTNSVWYLTRKVESTRPRTATLTLAGGDGVQIWVNGESVLVDAPDVPSPVKQDRRSGGNSGNTSRFQSQSSNSDRTVRIGLREGENEIVAKVAVQGSQRRSRSRGGETPPSPEAENANENGESSNNNSRSRSRGVSVVFNLEAEGEDIINHEIVTLLRDRLEGESDGPEAAPAAGDIAAGGTADDDQASLVAASVSTSGMTAISTAESKPSRTETALRKFYRRKIDTVGRILDEKLDELEREKSRLERTMPRTLVMKERKKPRDTHVFVRGSYKDKGEKVESGVPSVLPPLAEDARRDRLGLAQWLVSDDNPLTARVTVNRIWQQYFGEGLVRTPDDFGIRGDRPSHPELLDWLAVEFRESGWDLKALHKAIVLSATYGQSSKATPELLEQDPDNRLLARAPRQRLSAEMIRDNALSVSGLLVHKVGGPSVRPFPPAGLWQSVSRGQRYRKDRGDDQYRRGLYVYWKRGVPYPSMITFDAAKRETCTVKREESTTPLQALVLMNDQVYVEAGKMLGNRMLSEGGTGDRERLAYGFKLCTSRDATDAEIDVLVGLLENQRAHFEDEKRAKEFLSIGDAKPEAEAKPQEIAAWASIGRALLNLDATIHRG